MRISDWISDVCSSDLTQRPAHPQQTRQLARHRARFQPLQGALGHPGLLGQFGLGEIARQTDSKQTLAEQGQHTLIGEIGRASWRERVCSTGRSGWTPDKYKQTKRINI